MTPKENPSPNAADRLAETFNSNPEWLARIDDGRIVMHLTDAQFLEIRAALAKQQATPEAEQPRKQCALCWEKARVGSVCDACHSSMGTTPQPSPSQVPAAQSGMGDAVSLLALKQWLIEKGWWNKLPMSWFNALDTAIERPIPQVPAVAQAVPDSHAVEQRGRMLAGVTYMALPWYEGQPPFPQDQEWFIAETIYGDRVVLKSREGDHDYQYTTADHTYMAAKNVARWMQFPDCEYLPPSAATPSQVGDKVDAGRASKKHEGPCWRNSHADCGC